MVMGYLQSSNVRIVCASLTVVNINDAFKGCPRNVDLVSVDVDGVDYWLWKALKVKSRVAVVEYNASFGKDKSITVPYCDGFNRMDVNPLYHGASLKALTSLADEKGLKLVGCDSTGLNAFYVQKHLSIAEVSVEDAFVEHRGREPSEYAFKHIQHLPYIEVP